MAARTESRCSWQARTACCGPLVTGGAATAAAAATGGGWGARRRTPRSWRRGPCAAKGLRKAPWPVQQPPPRSSYFVPGSPHVVVLIKLLLSYQDYRMCLLTLAGRRRARAGHRQKARTARYSPARRNRRARPPLPPVRPPADYEHTLESSPDPLHSESIWESAGDTRGTHLSSQQYAEVPSFCKGFEHLSICMGFEERRGGVLGRGGPVYP